MVVLIIGILAAIALPQYTKAVEKSRFSEGLANARTLAGAAERHILAAGTHPTSFDQLDIDLPGGVTKISDTQYANKNFIYRMDSNLGIIVIERKLSPTDNIVGNAPSGIGYWFANDTRTTALTKGTLACYVRTTASAENKQKYISICKSLGGKEPVITASDGLHYKIN